MLGGRFLLSTSEWDGTPASTAGHHSAALDQAAEVVVWRLDGSRPECCSRLVGAQRRVTASAVSDDIVVVCTLEGMHVWQPPSGAAS